MRLVVVGLAVLAALAPQAEAQKRISIALVLTDSTNLFQSAFGAGFRGLGDVDVVTVEEHPDFVLTGVVLCVGGCSQADSYALSLRLYQPATEMAARYLSARLGSVRRPGTADSAAAVIRRQIEGYERTLNTWAAHYYRRTYEDGVRELVRIIDTRCFEADRVMNRVVARGPLDKDGAADLRRHRESRDDWIC